MNYGSSADLRLAVAPPICQLAAAAYRGARQQSLRYGRVIRGGVKHIHAVSGSHSWDRDCEQLDVLKRGADFLRARSDVRKSIRWNRRVSRICCTSASVTALIRPRCCSVTSATVFETLATFSSSRRTCLPRRANRELVLAAWPTVWRLPIASESHRERRINSRISVQLPPWFSSRCVQDLASSRGLPSHRCVDSRVTGAAPADGSSASDPVLR